MIERLRQAEADGALVGWVVCPICGFRKPLPVDARPTNDAEKKWLWNNVAYPMAVEMISECQWSESMAHNGDTGTGERQ
jgi:hypothetical protein